MSSNSSIFTTTLESKNRGRSHKSCGLICTICVCVHACIHFRYRLAACSRRRTTTPANKTPRPSEIQRARVVCCGGAMPIRSQMNIKATPMRPRNTDSVRTSEPAANRSCSARCRSQIANDNAAMMPGQRSASRRGEAGRGDMLTIESSRSGNQ